jgi:hypothetical protein
MREFSKISPAVWGSERFNNLASDDARYLYLYFLTCEHQTSAGVFRLKSGYALDDLQWDLARYASARTQLIEADLIHFDEGASTVLITRWFKHNCPMNDSHFKGVEREINKLPSEVLKLEALHELQIAYEGLKVSRAVARSGANVSDLSPGLKNHAARNGFYQAGRT